MLSAAEIIFATLLVLLGVLGIFVSVSKIDNKPKKRRPF